MTTHIKVDTGQLQSSLSQLRGGATPYCGFKLRDIARVMPCPAANDHDGRLGALCASALGAYAVLLEEDVQGGRTIGEGLLAADEHAAHALGARG